MSTNAIDPSKVKAGDTVWVRFIETGEELVTKAYRPESITEPGPWAFLLGWPLNKGNGGHGLAVKYFEILDHQPAEPEWQPGTVGKATVRGVEGVRVMRLVSSPTDARHHWVDIDGIIPDDSAVTDFVPDDTEALRRELRHLQAKVEGHEFGEATTIKLLRAEVERLSGDWRSLPEEVLERWASLSRAEAIRQAEQLSSSLKAQFAANAESAKIVAARWREKEAVARALGVPEVSNQAIHDAIEGLQAEVERLRAARTLPTREQVAELMRKKFGGLLEAWLDDADEILALFEQGGAAPKVTEEADAEGCPDDCGGCACHIAPPCTHCVEHVTEPGVASSVGFRPGPDAGCLERGWYHDGSEDADAAAQGRQPRPCPSCTSDGAE